MLNTTHQSHLHNPYVGPRPFQAGETLHGRDRETLELLDLLIAERIVLLYSPSGAGKTSLIQAELLPELAQEDFQPLPVMRISLEPPPEQAKELPSGYNRYVLSALMSLEEGIPTDQQLPLTELAGMTLAKYLERHWSADILPAPDAGVQPALAQADKMSALQVVLIVDQFEEILTVDPTDRRVKTAFFAQLGEVLRNENVYALLAMREEFPAGLDPYLRYIPTRLSTTFRLDLLGVEAAAQAMQEPATQAGIPFTDTAVTKLIDDLRTVRIQQPDGSMTQRPGLYVEPVQLQVVCYRLWNHLPQDATQIEEAHIQEAGDVNAALAGYYADRVRAAAEQTGIHERRIREWFDKHLITEQGIRGQVLHGAEQSQGLNNDAIAPLVDAHLVRAENRRGATWYELAHDRLIEPVRKNNAAWFQEHLSPLQRQAALWNEQRRTDGLLLRDDALQTAEQWANEHTHDLLPVEQEFLISCRELQQRIKKERTKNRLIFGLAIVAMFISVIVIYLWNHSRAVEKERTYSLFESQLTHASLLARVEDYAQAREVLNESRPLDPDIPAERRHARNMMAWFTDLMSSTANQTYKGAEVPLRDVALTPDGRFLVTVGEQGTIALFETNTADLHKRWQGHTKSISVATVHPHEAWFATAGDDQRIVFWSLPKGEKLQEWNTPAEVEALEISPDGTLLASGGADNTVTLWDAETGEILRTLQGHTDEVRDLAFSPNGKRLASASKDLTARIWDVDSGQTLHELRGHTGALNAIGSEQRILTHSC